ncbi:MAG TPA: hypothetical protein VII96_02525 [Acidimicrobiales bacterium]
MTLTPRRLVTAGFLAAVLTAAAGCGSSSTSSTSTSPPSTSAPTTSVPAGSTSTTLPGTTTTTGAPTVLPLAVATTNGAFLSPTKNLACLIAQSPSSQVRCASFSPPMLVTMTPDGTLTQCRGTSCELGNPALETKVLPYGSTTGNGTFTCASAPIGVTCTTSSGKGFLIAKSGIQAVGT